MKQKVSKQVFNGVLLFFLILIFAPLGYCAESTADVSVDAAAKEKIRQKILGLTASPVGDEYRVGYRDILHVSIYGEGSMSPDEGIQAGAGGGGQDGTSPGSGFIRGRGSGIEVRNDGRISVRHIGDVSVVGMTLTQLADYLKQLYSTIYDNPSVTVTLVQSNSQQYTVMGQVINPGLYHLDFPLTIVRAVARAGGFTEWANSDITVIRQQSPGAPGKKASDATGKTFKFDYDDFLKGQDIDNNINIESGDVIVVH